jgi:hypothetical protein
MSESRLPIHPYAQLFPPLTVTEFEALCGAILLRGLHEDIVLHEGKVLDGWHRYLACLAKAVTPRFRPYAGECGSLLAFVVDKNLNRRHLTESQRALLGARLRTLFEEEAQLRQRAGLKQGSELPVVENSLQRGKHEEKSRSDEKAAQLMKVSDFSVRAADKVKKQGVPELVDALAAGKVSVSAAARIAKLPAEQQQAVVAGIASGQKPKQALAQVHEKFIDHANGCVDDEGRPLPEGVVPVFRQREEFRSLCQRIEALSRTVERLSATPAGVHLDVQRVLTALEDARHTLWTAQPAHVCSHNPGDDSVCALCGGHGWLPQRGAA